MVGRPTKLTPEIQARIRDLLMAGNFVETVCDFVGIHRDTFYEWMRRGERGWKIDIDEGYVEFSDTTKKAIAQVEIFTVDDLRQGPLNWQAKAWWLERRHPDKWGNRGKQVHEHSGPNAGPIETKATVTHAIDGDTAITIFDILAAAGALPSASGNAEIE